jgi:23S rRNA pseudouridine1911/1915/1917 synthase
MNEIKITVSPEAEGTRADIFLTNFCEEISTRSAAQKLLSDDFVSIGKKVISKNYRVKTGDVLICKLPNPTPLDAEAENIPLNIVYEDNDLLVVDKPRGLVVHPAAGNHAGTLVNALLFHCELSGIGGVLRPGIVHRLDKDTSGLMVVAKNDRSHVALAAQLENRTMGRTYNALCVGALKKNLRIDLPIGRHPRDRKKMSVLTDINARARNAVTTVEILQRAGNFTLIAAHLETGRTHQIRVHMAHIGHPILGDTTYGTARQPHDLNGQILHAKKLKFTHPTSREEMEFDSPLPEYFVKTIQLIGGTLWSE